MLYTPLIIIPPNNIIYIQYVLHVCIYIVYYLPAKGNEERE